MIAGRGHTLDLTIRRPIRIQARSLPDAPGRNAQLLFSGGGVSFGHIRGMDGGELATVDVSGTHQPTGVHGPYLVRRA